MVTTKKKSKKNHKKLSFKNKGFSAFFLLVVVAMSIFLAGAFESTQTPNPVQVIPDPNQTFADPTGKDSLQLKTISFISVTPPPSGPIKVNCQDTYNTESKILIGSDPAPGGTASNGMLRIWVNDEGAPYIAPGEQVDLTTGAITQPGDRTAKDTGTDGQGKYLWEPAIYLTTITAPGQVGPFTGDAESGGKPYFPVAIKGDFNNSTSRGKSGKGSGTKGAPIDTDYINFENGPSYVGKPATTNFDEQYTTEFIWSVADLKAQGVIPGLYHAEEVIHDGDVNLAVNCVAIQIP